MSVSPCPYLTVTTVGQLSCIIMAMLAMTGRITMLGIEDWAGHGGSYRTVQRFFHTVISWPMLYSVFFRQHVLDPTDTYITDTYIMDSEAYEGTTEPSPAA